MNVIFRPLGTWPRPQTPNHSRKAAPFQADYNNTLKLLDQELRHLDVKEVVIQADVTDDDIRIDGMLRADARPRRPNIIIAAHTKFGPLQYLCDDCLRWQDNVRAIAMTLERLRMAERYGVTKRGEQYTGFRALPMGGSVASGAATFFNTADAAAEWLADCLRPNGHARQLSAQMIANREVFQTLYREAAKKFHPDNGGSVEDFQRLQAAKELIEKARGV